MDDQPPQRFKAGDAWYEAPGQVHRVARNPSASQPAVLVAWLLSDGRSALVRPVPHSIPSQEVTMFRTVLIETLNLDEPALRQQIAAPFVRRAHIRENHPHEIVVETVADDELYRRQPQAFLVDLARQRHRSGAHTADVGVVRTVGQVNDGRLLFR